MAKLRGEFSKLPLQEQFAVGMRFGEYRHDTLLSLLQFPCAKELLDQWIAGPIKDLLGFVLVGRRATLQDTLVNLTRLSEMVGALAAAHPWQRSKIVSDIDSSLHDFTLGYERISALYGHVESCLRYVHDLDREMVEATQRQKMSPASLGQLARQGYRKFLAERSQSGWWAAFASLATPLYERKLSGLRRLGFDVQEATSRLLYAKGAMIAYESTRDLLLKANYGLAAASAMSLARRLPGYQRESGNEGLISEAYVVMTSALDRWSPASGITFSSFVGAQIDCHLKAVVNEDRAIRLPSDQYRTLVCVKKAISSLADKGVISATNDEIRDEVDALGLNPRKRLTDETLSCLRPYLAGEITSLNTTYLSVDEGDNAQDHLVCESESPEDSVIGKSVQTHVASRLELAIAALPERERNAFVSYRTLGQTLREVGQGLGISPERVRQLICKAEAFLRENLSDLRDEVGMAAA